MPRQAVQSQPWDSSATPPETPLISPKGPPEASAGSALTWVTLGRRHGHKVDCAYAAQPQKYLGRWNMPALHEHRGKARWKFGNKGSPGFVWPHGHSESTTMGDAEEVMRGRRDRAGGQAPLLLRAVCTLHRNTKM